MADLPLDLDFPLAGDALPVDHGYPLYAALAGALPWLHDAGDGGRPAPGVFPVGGRPAGPGRLALARTSRLRLRLPPGRVADAVGLTARPLDVAGCRVVPGPPTVRPLTPAAALRSDLVLIKLAGKIDPDPASFLAAVDRQLAAMEVGGEASLPVELHGERVGRPRRKVMRVKGAVRVGYPTVVSGLTADDSLRLQSLGLGGRRRMGCGLFRPEAHAGGRKSP